MVYQLTGAYQSTFRSGVIQFLSRRLDNSRVSSDNQFRRDPHFQIFYSLPSSLPSSYLKPLLILTHILTCIPVIPYHHHLSSIAVSYTGNCEASTGGIERVQRHWSRSNPRNERDCPASSGECIFVTMSVCMSGAEEC